jgi:hypothetical protein
VATPSSCITVTTQALSASAVAPTTMAQDSLTLLGASAMHLFRSDEAIRRCEYDRLEPRIEAGDDLCPGELWGYPCDRRRIEDRPYCKAHQPEELNDGEDWVYDAKGGCWRVKEVG